MVQPWRAKFLMYAVLGAALSAQLPSLDAARLANLAAGVAVGHAGTYAISRAELLTACNSFGDFDCQ